MSAQPYKPEFTRPSMEEAIKPLEAHITGVHVVCDDIPHMSDREYDELVRSIRENGLLHPVDIDADSILLDGRGRIAACHTAGYTITDKDIRTTNRSPFVVATSNLCRRHMTVDQRAMAATALLEREQALAKQRQTAALRQGRKTNKSSVGTDSVPAEARPRKRRSSEIVAKAVELSREKVELASKVKKKDPVLASKVASGEVELAAAARQANVDTGKRSKRSSTKGLSSSAGSEQARPLAAARPSRVRFTPCPHSSSPIVSQTAIFGTLCTHRSETDDVLVLQDGEEWKYLPLDRSLLVACGTREQAEEQAVNYIPAAMEAKHASQPAEAGVSD